MRDRFVVTPSRRRNASQTKFGGRLRCRNAAQRLEQLLAPIEIPRFEERLGQLHPRGQLIWRNRQCLLELRRRVGVPGQALQHNRVEVVPGERSRRQRLGAGIRLVRGLPLLPGVQQAGERADRLGVVRTRGGVLVRARKHVARRRWK